MMTDELSATHDFMICKALIERTAVARAKSMESWRKEYMFLYELKDEGRAEGLEEGLEKGRKEGLKEGRAEGARDALLSLVRDGLITAKTAAERMDITEEEVQALLEEAKAGV